MLRRSQRGPARAEAAAEVSAPLVPVDRFLGSEAARRFVGMLAERRFHDLLPVLSACSTTAERAWAVQVAADDVELVEPLRDWCSAQPQSGLAAAAWGASLVAQAWARRGTGRAAAVQPEQAAEFHGLLRKADARLHQAAAMSPTSPLPWLGLLRSGRGLQISAHELRLRYEEAQRRNAPDLDAALQLLQGLGAEWSGSHEQMFAFADRASAAAPPGSPLHAVVAMAHIERGMSAETSVASYLPTVAEAIRVSGQRGVEDPQFTDAVPEGAMARNIMCFAYAFCGEHELALRQRDAIGSRLSSLPWSHLGAAEQVFRSSVSR